MPLPCLSIFLGGGDFTARSRTEQRRGRLLCENYREIFARDEQDRPAISSWTDWNGHHNLQTEGPCLTHPVFFFLIHSDSNSRVSERAKEACVKTRHCEVLFKRRREYNQSTQSRRWTARLFLCAYSRTFTFLSAQNQVTDYPL